MSKLPILKLPVLSNVVDGFERPRTRGDCMSGGRLHVRPCPWVSCKHNLLIDVLDDGGLVLNAGHKRPEGGGRVIPPNERTEERFRDEAEDAVEWWFDEIDPPQPSCVLDEAESRQPTDNTITLLDEIASVMYVTRERVRQIEAGAVQSLREVGVEWTEELRDMAEDLKAMRAPRDGDEGHRKRDQSAAPAAPDGDPVPDATPPPDDKTEG